jgi:hypothetical protein
LQANPAWRDARACYEKAELLYKKNFEGRSPEQKQGLRDSRKLLETARGRLDKVPQDLGDAAKLYDDLSKNVNSLLHDVEKRQGATGN